MHDNRYLVVTILLSLALSSSLFACAMEGTDDELYTVEGTPETVLIDAGTIARLRPGEVVNLQLDAPILYIVDYSEPFDFNRIVLHRLDTTMTLTAYLAEAAQYGFDPAKVPNKQLELAGDPHFFGTLDEDEIKLLEARGWVRTNGYHDVCRRRIYLCALWPLNP